MGDQIPAPHRDEIVVSAAAGRHLCNDRAHTRSALLAEVIVTFGELGTHWQPDALWVECWGRSYAMCQECWDVTRRIAKSCRPGLVITDADPTPITDRESASSS